MMNSTKTPAATKQAASLDKRRWIAFTIVLLAAFMDFMDATVVNVALPSIQRDLHATYSALQWVGSGYLLAYALLLITGGRLGDMIGRKRVFLFGVAGFTVASLLSGISHTSDVLITARILQGIMAALMVPQVLATMQTTFSKEERTKAIAIYGAITGMATVVGPVLAGLLIKANFFHWGWRSVFLINLPVGLIGLIGGALTLRNTTSSHAKRLDAIGMLLATAALLLLVYPLVQGRTLGWPAWTFASMILSVIVGAAFVAYERHKIRRGDSPLMVLSLFKKKSFDAGLIVTLAFGAGVSSLFFIFTLWLQLGLHFSAIDTGLAILPFPLATAFVAGAAGPFAQKFGRALIQTGAFLILLSLFGLMFTVHRYGVLVSGAKLIPAMVLYGIGFGLVIVPLLNFILGELKEEEAGSASGLVSTMQQLGGAVGIAVVGTLFFSLLGDAVGSTAHQFTSAMNKALWAEIIVYAIVLLSMSFLPKKPGVVDESDLLV